MAADAADAPTEDDVFQFELPVITMPDVELSQWLEADACNFRRKAILKALLFEIALERADVLRIQHRIAEKSQQVEFLALQEDPGNITDLLLELHDDEESSTLAENFADALKAAAFEVSGTFADEPEHTS